MAGSRSGIDKFFSVKRASTPVLVRENVDEEFMRQVLAACFQHMKCSVDFSKSFDVKSPIRKLVNSHIISQTYYVKNHKKFYVLLRELCADSVIKDFFSAGPTLKNVDMKTCAELVRTRIVAINKVDLLTDHTQFKKPRYEEKLSKSEYFHKYTQNFETPWIHCRIALASFQNPSLITKPDGVAASPSSSLTASMHKKRVPLYSSRGSSGRSATDIRKAFGFASGSAADLKQQTTPVASSSDLTASDKVKKSVVEGQVSVSAQLSETRAVAPVALASPLPASVKVKKPAPEGQVFASMEVKAAAPAALKTSAFGAGVVPKAASVSWSAATLSKGESKSSRKDQQQVLPQSPYVKGGFANFAFSSVSGLSAAVAVLAHGANEAGGQLRKAIKSVR